MFYTALCIRCLVHTPHIVVGMHGHHQCTYIQHKSVHTHQSQRIMYTHHTHNAYTANMHEKQSCRIKSASTTNHKHSTRAQQQQCAVRFLMHCTACCRNTNSPCSANPTLISCIFSYKHTHTHTHIPPPNTHILHMHIPHISCHNHPQLLVLVMEASDALRT